MVSAEQEAQQFQFLITAPMMLSFFLVFFAIRAPNDPLVVALSMFPFSAPIVMFARIVLGAASKSQIGISMAILLATIAFVIWLCGRIYRVGVLMYGKRPTLPEIIKWVRYA
jgi:ABC-2 type transport system permease protein